MKKSTAHYNDVDYKTDGNKLFSERNYKEAVICYSNAIIKNPNIPNYFTNRALCYIKMKEYEKACDDTRKALEIEKNHVKGHFFLGSALLELRSFDEALKHLHIAFDLAKEQKQNFGDEIASQIRLARKKRFNLLEDKRIAQEIELLTYLTKLITTDFEEKMERVRQTYQLTPAHTEEAVNTQLMNLEDKCEETVKMVNQLFSQVDERRRRREVPDYLCGKISFELLRDPVITPSGITYERKNIEEHLQKIGHFDPITREPLTVQQLVPNYAMKEVVDSFLQENEWALDY